MGITKEEIEEKLTVLSKLLSENASREIFRNTMLKIIKDKEIA